jgi:hypothetical protein
MATRLSGNALHSFPSGAAVGGNHVVTNAVGRGAPVAVSIPPPSMLTINGATFTIDLKTMGPVEIVAALNNGGGHTGIFAALDRDYHLQIDGVNTISGNAQVRAALGI